MSASGYLLLLLNNIGFVLRLPAPVPYICFISPIFRFIAVLITGSYKSLVHNKKPLFWGFFVLKGLKSLYFNQQLVMLYFLSISNRLHNLKGMV